MLAPLFGAARRSSRLTAAGLSLLCSFGFLAANACGDSGGGTGASAGVGPGGAGGDGADAKAGTKANAAGGEPSSNLAGSPTSDAGEPSGGSVAQGGSSGSTNVGGSAGKPSGGSGGSANALCAQADGNGFFSTCDACGTDCDTIDTNSGSRKACGCSSGCPCGFSCGCYQLGAGISVCDLCLR